MKARPLHGIEAALLDELRGLDSRFLLAVAHRDADVVLLARLALQERRVGPDGRWAEYSEAAAAYDRLP